MTGQVERFPGAEDGPLLEVECGLAQDDCGDPRVVGLSGIPRQHGGMVFEGSGTC